MPVQSLQMPLADGLQVYDRIGRIPACGNRAQSVHDAPVCSNGHQREGCRRTETLPRGKDRVDDHCEIAPLVQIAHVEDKRLNDPRRQLVERGRVLAPERLVDAKRRHRNAFRRNAVCGGDLRSRKCGDRQNMRSRRCATAIEAASQPVVAIGIPLRVAFVADVMNREDDRGG